MLFFFFFLSIFQCGPFVVVMGHGEDVCLPEGPMLDGC